MDNLNDNWLDDILGQKQENSENAKNLTDTQVIPTGKLQQSDDLELERIVQETIAENWGDEFPTIKRTKQQKKIRTPPNFLFPSKPYPAVFSCRKSQIFPSLRRKIRVIRCRRLLRKLHRMMRLLKHRLLMSRSTKQLSHRKTKPLNQQKPPMKHKLILMRFLQNFLMMPLLLKRTY